VFCSLIRISFSSFFVFKSLVFVSVCFVEFWFVLRSWTIICKSCFYVFSVANLFVSKLSLDSIWCSSNIELSAGQWLLLQNCIWVIQIWMCSEYSWGSGLAESIGYVSTLFLCILVSWISVWPVSRFWSSFINIFAVSATWFQFKTVSIFFVCLLYHYSCLCD